MAKRISSQAQDRPFVHPQPKVNSTASSCKLSLVVTNDYPCHLASMYQQHLNLPPSHHPLGHHHGRLALPSRIIVDIRVRYQTLFQYLVVDGQPPKLSTSPSLPRLRVLEDRQLLDLLVDLADEIERRAPEAAGRPALTDCLESPDEYPDSRKLSRQKLATLKTDWFRSLVVDVWTSTRQRHHAFTKDESSILEQAQRDQYEAQHQHQAVEESEAIFNDVDDMRTTFTSRHNTARPDSNSFQSEDAESHEEVVMAPHHAAQEAKPSWLLNAENLIKTHIGANRSSHDYEHSDRLRRQAVQLGRKARQRGVDVDLKVVELAALFAAACNDPKHCVKDPQTFITPWFEDNTGCLTKQQLHLLVRIVRTIGLKREERRRKEQRETEWHRTCTELLCVSDADKLEMIGLFGLMRTFASYGAMHRTLFIAKDAHKSSNTSQTETAISHSLQKERLLSLMRLPEAKVAAQQRYKRMQDFARMLSAEYELEGLV